MGARQPSWQIAFDGSGPINEDDTHFAYAGVVGSAAAWAAFTEKWIAILDREDIAYVRMTEALNWAGPFKKKREEWGPEAEAKRNDLLRELVGLVRQFDLRPIGYGLQPGALSEAKAALRKKEVFQMIMERTLVKEPSRKFVLLCDTEQDSADHFRAWINNFQLRPEVKDRIVALCFGDDKFFPPLQIADVAAYLLRKDAERDCFRPSEPPSELTTLLRGDGASIESGKMRDGRPLP